LYGCCNLLKREQYYILDKLGYLEVLSPYLISCDRPIVKDGKPYNCSKNGKPACGSGLLSYWACKQAGLEDTRNYYEVDDEEYEAFCPDSDLSPRTFDSDKIIMKLQIHPLNQVILHRRLMHSRPKKR